MSIDLWGSLALGIAVGAVALAPILAFVWWLNLRRHARYMRALAERNAHHCWCGLPLVGGPGGFCRVPLHVPNSRGTGQ